MFPKDELSSRFEQLPYLLHHGLWIPYRAEDLDGQHGIQAAFGDPLLSKDVAVFNSGNDELVLILYAILLQFGIYAILVAGVWLNTVDLADARHVKTVKLIAWPRA